MSHEDFVTYEQAVKLKSLGFDWFCNHYYDKSEEIGEYNDSSFSNYDNFNSIDFVEGIVSAPTLSQAQKWLREVKKIYVFSHIIGNPPRDKCKYYWKVETNNSRTVDSSSITELFLTYEEALSAGIGRAIEL